MEQQTLAPALIDGERFGNLVHIPAIADQNKGQSLRAVAAIRNKATEVATIDLATVDLQVMEAKYQELDALMAKGKRTLDDMEARRKPFTAFFDEVRSIFTSAEKDVKDAMAELKAPMDAWQREKARRAKIAQDEADKRFREEQESIRLRAERTTKYTNCILNACAMRINEISNGFYAQSLQTIDAYVTQLRSMIVVLNGAEYDKIIGEATPQSAEMYLGLSTEYINRIINERNRLLDLVDSRKAELTRIASDAEAARIADERIQKEQQEREAALDAEKRDREQATQLTAEADEMNASFDTAASAAPVVGLSKGTRVKQKYNVTGHAGMIALLQSYIKYNLPLLTVEEMNKKFSFVITAANARLNDGEVIEAKGLEAVEDYSTTSRRKAS